MSTRAKRRGPGSGNGLHRRWTQEETTILCREWHLVSMRQLRKLLPGRTIRAIHTRAEKLGILNAQTQGLLSLDALARRFGVASATMRRILERHGARLVRRHPSGTIRESKRKLWRTYADLDEAHAAFARWERGEYADRAAQRLNVWVIALRKRAMEAGVVKRGEYARLMPEQWDEFAKTLPQKCGGIVVKQRNERMRAA